MFRRRLAFLKTWGGLKLSGRICCDESGLVRLGSAAQYVDKRQRQDAIAVRGLMIWNLLATFGVFMKRNDRAVLYAPRLMPPSPRPNGRNCFRSGRSSNPNDDDDDDDDMETLSRQL